MSFNTPEKPNNFWTHPDRALVIAAAVIVVSFVVLVVLPSRDGLDLDQMDNWSGIATLTLLLLLFYSCIALQYWWRSRKRRYHT